MPPAMHLALSQHAIFCPLLLIFLTLLLAGALILLVLSLIAPCMHPQVSRGLALSLVDLWTSSVS